MSVDIIRVSTTTRARQINSSDDERRDDERGAMDDIAMLVINEGTVK